MCKSSQGLCQKYGTLAKGCLTGAQLHTSMASPIRSHSYAAILLGLTLATDQGLVVASLQRSQPCMETHEKETAFHNFKKHKDQTSI